MHLTYYARIVDKIREKEEEKKPVTNQLPSSPDEILGRMVLALPGLSKRSDFIFSFFDIFSRTDCH